MKKISAFPWYIFLLPLFYILHTNNSYFGLLSLTVSVRYLLYYFLLAVCCFIISRFFLRNNIKAAIWSTSFLIAFFLFGSFYDFLKKSGVPALFTSYTFLLSALLILLSGIFILLKKKDVPVKLNIYFRLLFGLMVMSEIIIFLFNIISNKQKHENYAGNNLPLAIHIQQTDHEKYPDIFFMVFDEYTSSLSLRKYYQFNNNDLDSALSEHNFYTSIQSQSNYNSTPLSIGSCFNMDYFQRDLEGSRMSLLEGAYTVKESLLPALLEKHGYQIINHGIFNLREHPASVTPVFNEFVMPFYLETLWGRINRDILWNLTTRLPGYKKVKPADQEAIDRNMNNFSRFANELKMESDKPRFVIGHLLLPHAPANIDRYGHARLITSAAFNDSLYLDQLLYANSLIDSLASIATKKRKRPLVLIIEGDHGKRDFAGKVAFRDKQFMNLNTYYFSDHDYSVLYDSISPINSFRVICNKYFDTRLPLLKDSTILLHLQ